jgi:hypothetical protein
MGAWGQTAVAPDDSPGPARLRGELCPRRLAPAQQLGLLVAMCVALAGCGSSTVSDAIAAQLRSTNAVDLRTAGAGDWDRVCVLGPYTGDLAAQETLGFAWPVESRSSIKLSDSISLLLFVQGQRVVHAAEHPRNQGDFSRLSGRCFPPGQARFVIRPGRTDDWPELVPRDAP